MKKTNQEETTVIKKFILILVIVLIITLGIYIITKYFVKKDTTNTSDTKTTEVSIDNSIAIVGTMLNKKDSSYYVIIYDKTSSSSSDYAKLVTSYKATSGAIPVFTVDLNNALNKSFYDPDNINLTATNVIDLRFGDITVLKVDNGSISKSYDSVASIKRAWKIS